MTDRAEPVRGVSPTLGDRGAGANLGRGETNQLVAPEGRALLNVASGNSSATPCDLRFGAGGAGASRKPRLTYVHQIMRGGGRNPPARCRAQGIAEDTFLVEPQFLRADGLYARDENELFITG